MADFNNALIKFIAASPSPFHAVNTIKEKLEAVGYQYIKESEKWSFKKGKFYTTRNNSSIIAFEIPEKLTDYHFQMCASHSDSPSYKIKAESELLGAGEYIKLNVEGYGGMIDYSWLDKPLSVAGRVFVKIGDSIVSKLLYIEKDILLIPSVAIHMNRDVNNGYKFNRAIDLCPLFSAGKLKKGDFDKMIAKELKVKPEDIVSKDLFLVNRQEGKVWGYKKEFVSTPKLDDLQAAFASLEGFASASCQDHINVYSCFDNEEVGSNTKQGAMSTFLKDTLGRINLALGKTEEDLKQALAKSFMLSFDNAHAMHPNHPELSDSVNHPLMNKGVVIKENAAQNYMTDAFSRAVFKEICNKANVPTQLFANRSDMRGGGTLGNISNVQVSVHGVDIGIAQLAMHSAYETAGSEDTKYAIDAVKAYYSSNIVIKEADEIIIK